MHFEDTSIVSGNLKNMKILYAGVTLEKTKKLVKTHAPLGAERYLTSFKAQRALLLRATESSDLTYQPSNLPERRPSINH